MDLTREDCLHCSIVGEIGRRLDRGTIDGQQALEALVLVLAELLATAPLDQLEHRMAEVVRALGLAESQARERAALGPAAHSDHV
jgi:hypothetical protein